MIDKEQLKAKLMVIRSGSEVERFHSERTLQVETVGHHSFNVAWLALMMCPSVDPERRLGLVLAAMSHDLAEFIVGDVPAPAKRKMGIGDAYKAAEKSILRDVGIHYESYLNKEDARVLKIADAMDGAFYCISEASLGNKRVKNIFANFRTYIYEFYPFFPAEEAIMEYIDELWERYGGTGM